MSILITNKAGTSTPSASQTFPQEQYNLGFSAGIDGSNNLIIMSEQADGASAPTAGHPVKVGFNFSPGVTQYGYQEILSTAQQTLTVPSGATLGLVSGSITQYVYLYELYNTELAVSGTLYEDYSIQGTSAVAGGTNLATIYSVVARGGQPIRLIGRMTFSLSTAGVWDSNPTDAAVVSYGLYKIPPSNFSISPSSGNFSTSSATFVTVPNLGVNLTTSGNPVEISLQSDGNGTNPSAIYPSGTIGGTDTRMRFQIVRDGSPIAMDIFGSPSASGSPDTFYPLGSVKFLDVPPTGAHTYLFQIEIDGDASTANVAYAVLVAREVK